MIDGLVQATELAHLSWKKHKTYQELLGAKALKRNGHKMWRNNVKKAVRTLRTFLECDYVVLGGGNAKLAHPLPRFTSLGSNANAFQGCIPALEAGERDAP